MSDPNGDTEHEIGNYFEAVVTDVAYGIEFLAGTNTTLGTSIDAVLYRYSAGDYIEIARSAHYNVIAGDTVAPKELALIDNTTGTAPIIQQDSLYFAAIYSFDDNFQIATSGVGPLPNTPTKYHSTVSFPRRGTATTTYLLTNTPMIRLSTEPILGSVEDLNSNIHIKISPNPSNGVFNINITSAETNNVNLTVKNVIGETILTETVNVAGSTNHQILLTDYSKGIYFLTVGNKTVKLVVD
jgi:hypothetical protein